MTAYNEIHAPICTTYLNLHAYFITLSIHIYKDDLPAHIYTNTHTILQKPEKMFPFAGARS